MYRSPKNSEITFMSEEPLDSIFAQVKKPFEDSEGPDWKRLKEDEGNTWRLTDPYFNERSQRFELRALANYFPSEDFLKYVVEPMQRVGMLPEAVVSAYS